MSFQPLNEYRMKIKINNNNDTRLWRYKQADDYAELRAFIIQTWSVKDFIAQYEDDENDRITIASSQDLKDALDFAIAEKKKSLKLFVVNYVKQKRAKSPPKQPKQQAELSGLNLIFDFLSSTEITTLLPLFFADFVKNKLVNGKSFKQEEIVSMLLAEIGHPKYEQITAHPLYRKYASLAIPYLAKKIYAQQSLYAHFGAQTIQNWIKQFMALMMQVFEQSAVSKKGLCAFKNLVVDIEYPPMTDAGEVIHFGVECDLCGMYPIIGDRYKCSICPDWDCCTACEPKHDHPLIKYKKSSKTHANASFNGLSEIFGKLSMHMPEEKVDDNDVEDEFADIYDDEQAAEAVIDCICGTKMALVRARDAYKHCNTVYCDICNEQFLESHVYHCPLGYDIKHHANGYDVCTKCASKKKVEESEENEIEIDEDMKSELDSNYSETESAVVVEKMDEVEKEKPKEEKAEIVIMDEEEFEFAAQLAQIKEIMALDTAERDDLIKGMLVEAKGDISKVVPLLFQ